MTKITDGIRPRGRKEKKSVSESGHAKKEKSADWLSTVAATPHEEVLVIPELQVSDRPAGKKLLFWGLVSGIAVVAALALWLSFVFSRLTVSVKPRIESVAFQDVSVALDASVSRPLIAQKVIPAEIFQFSRKTQVEFESSGKEFIEDKAKGKVMIYNQFSSSAQTLVEGTRFLTDKGMLFRLAKTIVIPGAKIEEGKIIPESIEAELAADKAGEESNVSGETTLKIPGFKGTAKYESFYGIANTGFTGGFKGQARVVSAEDLKKAQEQVTKQVFDELKQEILRKVPTGFTVLDALREIQVTKVISPRPGTRRDRFPVEAEARGKVAVFREADLQSILRGFVLGEHTDRDVVENSFRIEYRPRTVEYEKKRAQLTVRGDVKVKMKIPREELAALLKGKKEGSIIEILKGRGELASFNVAFFPPWLFSAPKDPSKIYFVEGD